MVKVDKTVLVHHSAAQMFQLVDDVEHYTEFLPWCGGVDLIKRSEASFKVFSLSKYFYHFIFFKKGN